MTGTWPGREPYLCGIGRGRSGWLVCAAGPVTKRNLPRLFSVEKTLETYHTNQNP